MNRYLTSTNPELEQQARCTPAGMAHWSGTGPAGATCKQCAHHRDITDDRGRARRNRCAQYRTLSGSIGGTVPGDTPACRHFVVRQ
jgi:hypothetical protein